MCYSNFYPSSGMFHASLPLLMGTRLDVLLFGFDKNMLENVWKDMKMEFIRLEKMFNRFNPDSEVAKINNDAQFSDVRLSDELWEIMLDCRRYYEKTDGFFDVTCTNFNNMVLMENTHHILFERHGMFLDFGGYAKGYALKCVRKKIEAAGIKVALINFGNSSVLALGAHPFGDSWTIQIDHLSLTNRQSPIRLYDNSLSVSGNTVARKAHIVNPKTAEYITGNRMAAVVADDPLDAEVLTTAWIASGCEFTPDWMSDFMIDFKTSFIIT